MSTCRKDQEHVHLLLLGTLPTQPPAQVPPFGSYPALWVPRILMPPARAFQPRLCHQLTTWIGGVRSGDGH